MITHRRRQARGIPIMGLMLMLAAAGCGSSGESNYSKATLTTPPAEWRIVCGTPGIAEMVFALGAGERVVGVSDYTLWPPEATQKPRIGGWINPDRERLIRLQPDVILTQGTHERLATYAHEAGIEFRSLSLERIDDILEQALGLADLLGIPEQGYQLKHRIKTDLKRVQQAVSHVPPRTVALLFSRPDGKHTTLTTVGEKTFLSDLLTIAGGTNIFSDAHGPYPMVSLEALLLRQPDVIIELHATPIQNSHQERLLKEWKAYSMLNAVRQGQVYLMTDDFLLIPGPRITHIAEQFANLLHPGNLDD